MEVMLVVHLPCIVNDDGKCYKLVLNSDKYLHCYLL